MGISRRVITLFRKVCPSHTSLEQIDLAGNSEPLPERWSVERLRPHIGFSTRSVLRALFHRSRSFFCQVVFLLILI